MSEPSIFVIFEKHQAYPEYVIQYTASTKPPAATPTFFSTSQRLPFVFLSLTFP